MKIERKEKEKKKRRKKAHTHVKDPAVHVRDYGNTKITQHALKVSESSQC